MQKKGPLDSMINRSVVFTSSSNLSDSQIRDGCCLAAMLFVLPAGSLEVSELFLPQQRAASVEKYGVSLTTHAPGKRLGG